MSRALLIIANDQVRARAMDWVKRAPLGTRVSYEGPKRTVPQSDRFHAMLTDVANQVDWYGRKWPMEDWKDWFKHMLKVEARWMPGEDGAPVPIGWSSASWTKETMSDAMELIEAFGARYGVQFHAGRGEGVAKNAPSVADQRIGEPA